MQPVLGQLYTREEIRQMIGGGDLQSYLPHVDGNVICGCFDPKRNASAPFEIDLGSGPNVLRYAQRLMEQGTFIPVFLKSETLSWEYVGKFKAINYITDKADLYPAKPRRRPKAVAVLYLAVEDESAITEVSDDTSISLQTAIEGGKALITHFHRERSRQLLAAKRRAYKSAYGHLSCECCGLSELELPQDIGEACYEIHHLRPVGDRQMPEITHLDDLAILCANCHRLIHRTSPMISVSQLSQLRGRDA